MRFAALALLLSLVSPSVVAGMCELVCLHADHVAGAATGAECHGADAAGTPLAAVSGAARVHCHGEAPSVSAIVKTGAQPTSTPAALIRPRPIGACPVVAGTFSGRFTARPPGLVLKTTPLRL